MVSTGAFVVGPKLLERGAAASPLTGATFAAKEVFDVAGLPTGAGSPTRRAERSPAEANAWVVDAMLGAGADLMGTTVTDELAFSLSGTNVHDGTPRHPIDPSRVPGGSSAGSASAVAHGVIDIGLGTDTGGSIRVPASYCGIFGLRPTHGRLPVDGLVPLAPSFDTVGLLTRSISMMTRAWSACTAPLPASPDTPQFNEMFIAEDLFDLLDSDVTQGRQDFLRKRLTDAAQHMARRHGLSVRWGSLADVVGVDVDEMLGAFRALQMHEIWVTHGRWITERQPEMGPGIRARFEMARSVTIAEVDVALPIRERCRGALHDLTAGGTVIAQPAASGTAPLIEQDAETKNDMRRRTLQLTTPAGLAGLPVLEVPAAVDAGLPVGLALVGPRNSESGLIELAGTETKDSADTQSDPVQSASG